ncbi:hypothetical protein I316_07145 [Kwoniella heveanensis BCC8398]|uniref:Uncharacterized protein n=1 Tax=Kwoniella heveanensis BCC8398 TaxID=1296120 RepID=A0A1B9GJN2_9TREE|nr:hypothetical protein I316_07145 [Kwoniella heveanensis BCC8398]
MLAARNIPSLILAYILASMVPGRISAVPVPMPVVTSEVRRTVTAIQELPALESLVVRHVSAEPSSSAAGGQPVECTSTTSPCLCDSPTSTASSDASPSSPASASPSAASDSLVTAVPTETYSKFEHSSSAISATSEAESSSTFSSSPTSSSSLSDTSSTFASESETESQTQTETSSASEPEKTSDDNSDGGVGKHNDGEEGTNGEEPSGKFGSLTFRLGQHTMLMNETVAMDNRAEQPKTVDFTLNNNQPSAYAGKWTFIAFGENDGGDWGMNVEGSQVKSSITCSIRLDVGSESDSAVVELIDTAPYYNELDPSDKLTMKCDSAEAEEKGSEQEEDDDSE